MDLQTISLILTLVAMSGGGVWQLSRVEAALRKDIARARDEIEAKHDQERESIHVKLDQDARHFGETIAAIRQKVADVELYAANHYVRRDGFYKVQEEIKSELAKVVEKIEKRLERMELKLDSKT